MEVRRQIERERERVREREREERGVEATTLSYG